MSLSCRSAQRIRASLREIGRPPHFFRRARLVAVLRSMKRAADSGELVLGKRNAFLDIEEWTFGGSRCFGHVSYRKRPKVQ